MERPVKSWRDVIFTFLLFDSLLSFLTLDEAESERPKACLFDGHQADMERPVKSWRDVIFTFLLFDSLLSFLTLDETESERPKASLVDGHQADIRGLARRRTSLSFMRRELPRTRQRGLVTAQRLRGFSFPCHSRSLTLCFIVGVAGCDWFAYAAFARASCSTLEPIAQMNPTSSRATAVKTFPGCLL